MGNVTSYCSGTTIHHLGHITIITASHLFRDEKKGGKFVVKFSDGSRHSAWLIGFNHSRDLALLAVSRPPIIGVKVSNKTLQIGDIVTTWGWVNNYPQSATRGPVLHYGSPTAASSDSVIRVSGRSSPGRSGGAILDSSGELAGVIWGAAPDGIRGCRIEYVRVFLRELLGKYQRENIPSPSENTGDPSVPEQPDAPLAPLTPDGGQDTGGEQAGPAVDSGILAELSEIKEMIRANRDTMADANKRSLENDLRIEKLEKHAHDPLPLVPVVIDEAAVKAMSDEAIAALAARLPPLTFQALLPNGEEYGDPVSKHLGETLEQDSILFSAKSNQPVGDAK